MNAMNLVPVTGTILTTAPFSNTCGGHLLTLTTENGPVQLIVTSDTYVADSAWLRPGMRIAAFHDRNAPVPLIFPPQFRALVVTQLMRDESVTIRFFDQSLTASDNSLRLNLGPATRVNTTNGQLFTCRPGNRTLMVYYSAVTRSIPPQTTPRRIIVF